MFNKFLLPSPIFPRSVLSFKAESLYFAQQYPHRKAGDSFVFPVLKNEPAGLFNKSLPGLLLLAILFIPAPECR
jgi:hypothetical protein